MHAICLCAQAYISAKLGRIREIKVSMQSGKPARHIWPHNMTQANKLVCMNAIFLRARIHILVKLCQISKIKVSMESGDYFPHVWTYSSSCDGVGGSKRGPNASHRGQRPPNSSPQEQERGAPGCPKILVLLADPPSGGVSSRFTHVCASVRPCVCVSTVN